MKEVHVDEIISALEKLFIDANYDSSRNVVDTLEQAIDKEEACGQGKNGIVCSGHGDEECPSPCPQIIVGQSFSQGLQFLRR